MSILRKPSKQELNALKEAAVATYNNRQHGYDAYADTDPKTGRAIGKVLVGAYIAELVPFATQLIPVYLAKTAEGYTPHELGAIPFAGTSYHIYFYKPQAEQDADIKLIHAAVEAEHRRELEESNRLIVERQVALEEAAIDRQVEKELAAERQAQRDAIEARVRLELSK